MAKTIREEDLRVNVVVNGDPARKKILDLEKAVDASTASIRQMRKEQEMLAKQGQTDSARYKELTQAIKTETASVKQNKAEMDALRKQMSLGSMTISELTNRAKQLRTQLAHAAPGSAEWKRLNQELSETNIRLNELRGQSGRAGAAINSFTSTLSKWVVGFAGALMIMRRVWSGVNKIADFEQANVNLATILRVNVEEMHLLTEDALRLGAELPYTAAEVTGLQTELAKLGFAQREILDMTEPTLKFAISVGADLNEAAAFAGAGLRAFGLDSSQTTEFLEVMAAATTKSALDFNKLQTSISIVAPVAKSFGLDAKETAALLGVLANAGFDASMAATALRNILLETAKDGGKVQKAVGGEVKTFDDLADAFDLLKDKGLDLAQANDLVGKRAASAFLVLADGIDTVRRLRGELSDTDGILEDIADKRMDTVKGAIVTVQSKWERFILSLSNSKGFIKDAINWVGDLISAITPKEEHATADELGRRTSDYVRGLWNMYEVDMANGEKARKEAVDRVSTAIDEDQAELEQQLRSAEAKLEVTSGARNKRRWKKEVERLREGVEVVRAARQELADRLAWGSTADPTFIPIGDDDDDGGDGGDGDKKHKKSWSLQSDESFLAAKAALTKKYNDQEIASQEEYEKQLYELEVATLTARIASRKDSAADRAKLESDLQDKIRQQREKELKKEQQLAKERNQILADMETDAVEKARRQEDIRYAEEQKKYEGNTEMLELIEKRHLQNVAKIEMDAQNQAMSQMQRRHEIERAELENHWLDRIAKVKKGSHEEKELRRHMNQELGELDLKYLNSLHTLLEHIVDTGEFEGIAIPEEQLDAFKKKLQEVIKQITETSAALAGEQEGGFWSGSGNGSLFGVSQDKWDQFFSNLSKGKFGVEDLGNAVTAMGGLAQEGFRLVNQAITMVNAKEQQELKAYQAANETKKKDLQDRLKSGLMTQEQYDAELEKLEAEQEAREEELALRQAEREKRMNIAQAIINTALSITKTFAQWGWPAGIAPAAIMGAIGAAQVAMMASTPVTGREQGGAFDQDGRPVRVRRKQDGRTFPARLSPNRRGYINGPTVLVGESGQEYVIPNEALQNPSVAPFVDAIETARRSGRLRDLRLDAVQPRMAMAGRASGGYFADEGSGDVSLPDGTRIPAGSYAELLQLLRKMNTVFSKPIRADVSMLGRNGIIEKTEEYNRARRGGRLNG